MDSRGRHRSRDYKFSGDVSVAYDNQGHAFLCYIAFDKLGTENYWAHGATRNGIFVRRSLDGGQTWDKDASIVIAHSSDPGIPFEDKPYIVADATHSKYAGNLYIGWTEFSLDKSIMLFSRSTDVGKTWSKPIEISTRKACPATTTARSRVSPGRSPRMALFTSSGATSRAS